MGEKRIQLCLVIHNHQPVGNFDHVIGDACDRAYLPFLRTMLDFPKIKIGLHTSGCLLEWMERGCPEYFELVRELLTRGQLELLGGGMYEPILPILTERDASYQLNRMNSYIADKFGVVPQGMWLAERVWEPHLPQILDWAGLRYTLLDDFHFRGCALPQAIETGYFHTQHANGRTALFPISEKLRYTMPFRVVEDTFAHLNQLGSENADIPLQFFGDDGEKFGVWPETFVWVYERGWLRDFWAALSESLSWIDLLLPVEVLDTVRAAGEVYIPCCSYKEMGEWTRVDPDAGHEAPPGHWRNYLTKYCEAQALYDRMVGVSALFDEIVHPQHPAYTNLDTWTVRDELARAQCNCSYWHGVFGGLYLNNLRHALNACLLRAEQGILSLAPTSPPNRLFKVLNVDEVPVSSQWRAGSREVPPFPEVIRRASAHLSIDLNRERGLTLTRLDQYDPPFVWTNVLTRRKEHYHKKLGADYVPDEHASIHDRVVTKEEGLEDRLMYDPHPRCSFNCYLAPAALTPEQFLLRSVAEQHRWAREADDYYSVAEAVERDAESISGLLYLGAHVLKKRVSSIGRKLELAISSERNGDRSVAATGSHPDGQAKEPAPLMFWVEFNFNVLTDQAEDRYLIVDGVHGQLWQTFHDTAQEIRLCDGWQQRQLVLTSAEPATLVVYPIYTVSSSEGGFERTYQGSCFMLGYPLAALDGGIEITVVIEDFHHGG